MRTQSQLYAATLSLVLLSGTATPCLPQDSAAAPAAPTSTATPVMATPTAADQTAAAAAPHEPKMIYRPGQALTVDTDVEDITPTYDVALAQKQVAAYPDSPEASFILAVALTRTSRVEEALKEVQRARKLAEAKGGPQYFDKMIGDYEKMLTNYPNDNRVRYGLAWAYYMKAYLLSRQSRRVAAWKAANPELAPLVEAQQKKDAEAKAAAAAGSATTSGATTNVTATAPVAPKPAVNNKDVTKALQGNPAAAASVISSLAANAGTGKAPNLDKIPHIPGALEKVDPADVPQIRTYFEQALKKIDEILKREPNDVWSIVYGAHLRAEYTGNLQSAMKVWQTTASKFPNNPASYFFLGEGYLKQGNLKESINNVSRAIALRALGN